MTDKDWPALYAEYLRSQEWADRRAKVMVRARHRCEGCGDRPATDVHHLTYEHVTQEFLFELVALCQGCHERIHDLPTRPRAPSWTPRHSGKQAPRGETPAGRSMRNKLTMMAAEARAKLMAGDPPAPPPPTAEQIAELATARRTGQAPNTPEARTA